MSVDEVADRVRPPRTAGGIVTSSPGSRSKTMPGGGSRLSVDKPPLRDVHLESGLLGDPGQAVDGVDDRIGRRAGPMGDAFAVQPVGRGAGELLLEEGRLVDAVGPTLAGDGSACDVRDHRLGDVDVVVEHLGLGGTRRRVQHLVRVGQLYPADSIHHAKVIPAVPLSDEAICRCLPARGRCGGRRRPSSAGGSG